MRDEFKPYCHEGSLPEVVINNADRLTKEQTITVLELVLEVVKTKPLRKIDSTTIGNKYTDCNWGICSEDPNVHPEPAMHTFPQDFADHQRISSLPLFAKVQCPMRKGKNISGCFYQCRVFQKNLPNPSREQAIHLYETIIRNLQTSAYGG